MACLSSLNFSPTAVFGPLSTALRPSFDGFSNGASAAISEPQWTGAISAARLDGPLAEAQRHLEDEDYEAALESASNAASALLEKDDKEGYAETQRLIVACLVFQERYAEAKQRIKEQIEAFDRSDDKYGSVLLRLSQANLATLEGDAESGFSVLDGLQAPLMLINNTRLTVLVGLARARLLIRTEKLGKAWDECKAARKIAETAGDKLSQAFCLSLESVIIITGEADAKGALAASSAALSIFRSLGQKREAAQELLQFSRIELLRRKWEAALAPLAEAEFLLQSLQNPSYQALHTTLQLKVQGLLGKKSTQAASQAVDRMREALRLAGKDKSILEVSILADVQVHILLAEGRLSDSLKVCELALDIARTLNSSRAEAGVLTNFSLVRWLMGDLEEATTLAQNAFDIFQNVLRDFGQAGVLAYRLALMTHKQDQHEDALSFSALSRALFEQAHRKSSAIMAMLLEAALRQVGDDIDSAEKLLNEALLAAQEAGDGRTEAVAYLGFASLFLFGKTQDANRFESGLVALEKAEAFLRGRLGEERLLADALHAKSLACLILGELESALGAVQEAQLLFQKVDDETGLAETLRLSASLLLEVIHRGGVEYAKANPKAVAGAKAAALRQAEESVKLHRKTRDKRALASSLNVLAQAYNAGGASRKGLEASQEAEQLFNEVQDRSGEAQALVVAADSCIISNDRHMAEGYAEQAALIYRAVGDAAGESLARSVALARLGGSEAVPQKTAAELQDAAASAAAAAPTEEKKEGAKLVALDLNLAMSMARDAALQAMGVDEDLDEDIPLMDAGLDSLAAISFRELLISTSGLKLPSSLVFDYPSLNSISQFLVEASSDAGMKA